MRSIFNRHNIKAVLNPLFLTSIIGTVNILFFYRKNLQKLWSNCLSYFIKDQIPAKNILTYTQEYVEKSKDIFFNYQHKNIKDSNDNIEKEFYNKELYTTVLAEENNKLDSNWKKRILVENTPRGNVYMYYDAYKLGFSYYSDINSLPYHLLNAVAMKYCRTFKCIDFFIDQNIVSKEYESPLIKIHHIENKKEMKKNNNKIVENAPFIKYKKNSIEKSIEKTKDKENIITNKFISLGKLYNLNILYKPPTSHIPFKSSMLDTLEKESSLQNRVMSYKEYRNMHIT